MCVESKNCTLSLILQLLNLRIQTLGHQVNWSIVMRTTNPILEWGSCIPTHYIYVSASLPITCMYHRRLLTLFQIISTWPGSSSYGGWWVFLPSIFRKHTWVGTTVVKEIWSLIKADWLTDKGCILVGVNAKKELRLLQTTSAIVLNYRSSLGNERLKESEFQSGVKNHCFVSNNSSVVLRHLDLKRHCGWGGASPLPVCCQRPMLGGGVAWSERGKGVGSLGCGVKACGWAERTRAL